MEQRTENLQHIPRSTDATQLADVLERILDKGLVIAADVRVKVVDIELLTINIRLLLASVDKAKEMGIDWWEHSPFLSQRNAANQLQHEMADKDQELARLHQRVADLERLNAPPP